MSAGIHWPNGLALAEAWGLPLVERHDSVASTQDRALVLAREGAAPWTAVVANEQTNGRGRRGRGWDSARGLGLWLSLVMPSVAGRPDSPNSSPSLPLTLRLGIGLAEAIARVVPEAAVQVKWPNDVWLNERKVAGILTERVGEHTIAGLGVNVSHDSSDFAEEMRARATSLWLEGWRGDAVQLGATIVASLRDVLDRSDASVLAALQARDALFDQEFSCPDGRIGLGSGIDEDGALLVRNGKNEWRVTAGTIHLIPAQDVSRAGG